MADAVENSPGHLASYSQIAGASGYPKASRAAGNAVGANPVALLIPCHRVIQQSGAPGGYRWGIKKKQMVQTWEYVHHDNNALFSDKFSIEKVLIDFILCEERPAHFIGAAVVTAVGRAALGTEIQTDTIRTESRTGHL